MVLGLTDNIMSVPVNVAPPVLAPLSPPEVHFPLEPDSELVVCDVHLGFLSSLLETLWLRPIRTPLPILKDPFARLTPHPVGGLRLPTSLHPLSPVITPLRRSVENPTLVLLDSEEVLEDVEEVTRVPLPKPPFPTTELKEKLLFSQVTLLPIVEVLGNESRASGWYFLSRLFG